MNNNFLQFFHNNLMKEDFFSENFYFENSNIAYFFKELGNNIYIILPLKDSINNYENIFSSFEENLSNNSNLEYINNIFLLEIILSENITEESVKYITYDSNFENKIIKSKWLIDLNENKIIVKGKQANSFLNVNKIIKNSFSNEFNNNIYENLTTKNNDSNIYLTLSLIAILFVIHFYSLLKNEHTSLINFFSTTPTMFKDKEYYRVFTAAFLHADISHIASNCLSLYIFGSRIEKYIGKLNFIFIYTIGIIASSIASYFFSNSYSIGASGAIFALEGAILYYSLKLNKKLDGLDSFIFITLAIVGISMGFTRSNIDNSAHIGGFISGIICSYIILLLEKSSSKNNC